jgi:hypothetical protein
MGERSFIFRLVGIFLERCFDCRFVQPSMASDTDEVFAMSTPCDRVPPAYGDVQMEKCSFASEEFSYSMYFYKTMQVYSVALRRGSA